ncbi:primase-helicase family protein [Pseudorhodoplanes sp.]|uniref:primase-helicase family protein n=1 Tax=Pseudorhodoplanes sp. TaxID=1934341 RepID=UPI00391E000B
MNDTKKYHRIAGRVLGEGDHFSGPEAAAKAERDQYRAMADWYLSDGDSLPGPSPAPATAPDAAAPAGESEAGPRAWGFDVEALNREYALVKMGSRAVVIQEQDSGSIEDRVRILTPEAFRLWYANKPTEVVSADGKTRTINWAQAWLQHRERRQYQGVEFYPNPDGAPATLGYLNLWRGFAVEPSEHGTWHIFHDHLLMNVCDGDVALYEWVFGWFAHMIQRPRERIGTALVLRGVMGAGKSKVGEVIGSLFPSHYYQVDDPRYITGQFNAHQASCLLLQADEGVWAGDPVAAGRLKGLITSSYQQIEAKGVDPIRVRNFIRLLMTSNEGWVVPAGMGERRHCVLDVNPRCAQKHDYFREMDEELAAGGLARLLHDLMNFDLSEVNLRQIPYTRALLEQKMRSFDPLESWWFNRLTAGAQTRGADTWSAEVVCGALYDDYVRSCETVGVGRRRDPATFGAQLAKLVPGLTRQRRRRRVTDGAESQLVWLYVFPDLAECREAFDMIVGQPCDWPAASAGESEAGEKDDDADDLVPL